MSTVIRKNTRFRPQAGLHCDKERQARSQQWRNGKAGWEMGLEWRLLDEWYHTSVVSQKYKSSGPQEELAGTDRVAQQC